MTGLVFNCLMGKGSNQYPPQGDWVRKMITGGVGSIEKEAFNRTFEKMSNNYFATPIISMSQPSNLKKTSFTRYVFFKNKKTLYSSQVYMTEITKHSFV